MRECYTQIDEHNIGKLLLVAANKHRNNKNKNKNNNPELDQAHNWLCLGVVEIRAEECLSNECPLTSYTSISKTCDTKGMSCV